MGLDNRPSRTSKLRAIERVAQQQQTEDQLPEDDPDAPSQAFTRSPRAKRTRASRRGPIESSDDDDHTLTVHPSEHPEPEEQPLDYNEQSPLNLSHPENGHEHSDDDDVQPLREVYMSPPQLVDGAVVTKSGRISKKPLPLSPVISPHPRQRRVPIAPSLTREQRAERRSRRLSDDRNEFLFPEELDVARSRSRPAKQRSYRIDPDRADMDLEDEDLIEKKDDQLSTAHHLQSRITRSRTAKDDDRDPRNGHRRISTRRRSTNPVSYADDPMSSGVLRRSSRRNDRSRGGKFMPERKDSDGEAQGDRDFPSPATAEDSEDMEERGFEEQDVLDGEHHGDDSESDYQHQRGVRRSTRAKRARKTQPQRSVPAKRSLPSKRRTSRPESSLARETRKSYRPRRESIRPADFYPEVESSDDSFSDGHPMPAAKRLRPTRAAASRAGDIIANKLAPEDYLRNPMSLDPGLPMRAPKGDRYIRRINRLRPTGKDPFASDGDDALGVASAAVSIEPIQVDFRLSWDDIGGLDHHVRALKEMVSLPLLYPEVFEKFKMEAPKGVLFYGPPGTGKTLCARALAASCGGDPVSDSAPITPEKTTEAEKESDQTPTMKAPEVTVPAADVIEKENEEQMKPDAPMLDINSEPRVAIGENGLPVPVPPSAESSQPKVDEVGIGPGTIANEHEAVVTMRSNEVQNRLREINAIEKTTAEENKGSQKANTISKPPAVKKKPRVSFFMRNGADCLSKWVGEAERQLRMTFEAAKKHQPSIIFFDEIDGLAPVRSSRQDQIHSSIVSTLLGLMDGLDARGQVVVIGATNRVDAIDPALRRPGRFDRELIFTLPNVSARRRILDIHTTKWAPPPSPTVLDSVSKLTVGYCGADLKSLCSEAAIRALRRRYPQIYESKDKLMIDVDEVKITTRDFLSAMKEIVPSSHRSARTHARPISERLVAVLNEPFQASIALVRKIFPHGLEPAASKSEGVVDSSNPNPIQSPGEAESDSEDDDAELRFEDAKASISNAGKVRPTSGCARVGKHQTLRPRALICGLQGLGQAQLGPAILQACEGCPVHAIDYPSLHADAGARSAEEALISAFREALRSVPSILYLPHLQLWWESAPQSLRTTLIIALKDLPADLPLLVLAMAESPLNDLPAELVELFGETLELSAPSEQGRMRMFEPLLQEAQAVPTMSNAAAKILRHKRKTEVLSKAPPPPPKPPTRIEVSHKMQAEDRFIRRLRMDMRAFVETLLRDRRFKAFWHAVDPTSAPDYYDIIKVPMDISKIAAQIDLGQYPTVLAMVNDFDIMVKNAIQYNPPNTEMGAAILRRAHGLIDIVHAWVDNLNPAIVEMCNKIIANRVARSQAELDAKEAALKAETEKSAEKGASEGKPNEAVPMEETVEVANEICQNDEAARLPEAPSYRIEVNGQHSNDGGDEKVPMVDAGQTRQEMVEEPAITAGKSDVLGLKGLLLAVSTGVSVDGLEGLYVRCAKILHEQRRCMDRAKVVQLLIETVTAARDDPAVVGKLVM